MDQPGGVGVWMDNQYGNRVKHVMRHLRSDPSRTLHTVLCLREISYFLYSTKHGQKKCAYY